MKLSPGSPFLGLSYDTIVFDLKTGRQLFSFEKDFGFPNVCNFQLEKDRIFFLHDGKISCMKFGFFTAGGRNSDIVI